MTPGSSAAAIAGAAALQVTINSQLQSSPSAAPQTIHIPPAVSGGLTGVGLALLLYLVAWFQRD